MSTYSTPTITRKPLKFSLIPFLSPHLKHVPLSANNNSMGTITCFIWILRNGHESGHYNNSSNKKLAIGKELFETMYFKTRIARGVESLKEMEWSG